MGINEVTFTCVQHFDSEECLGKDLELCNSMFAVLLLYNVKRNIERWTNYQEMYIYICCICLLSPYCQVISSN
jgi:hypothetical protein